MGGPLCWDQSWPLGWSGLLDKMLQLPPYTVAGAFCGRLLLRLHELLSQKTEYLWVAHPPLGHNSSKCPLLETTVGIEVIQSSPSTFRCYTLHRALSAPRLLFQFILMCRETREEEGVPQKCSVFGPYSSQGQLQLAWTYLLSTFIGRDLPAWPLPSAVRRHMGQNVFYGRELTKVICSVPFIQETLNLALIHVTGFLSASSDNFVSFCILILLVRHVKWRKHGHTHFNWLIV